MAEDNKSMFVLISIVAIVAVVGLVVLLMGKSTQYVPVAQPAEAGVAEGVDLAGEAASSVKSNVLCGDRDKDEPGYGMYVKSYAYGQPRNPNKAVQNYYDYCMGGDYKKTGKYKYIVENICDSSGFVVSFQYECRNGCVRGACIE